LPIVLFVVILAATVAVALLGLGMCRLSALSDRRHTVELAEWIAASSAVEQDMQPAEPAHAQILFDGRGETFRATG
jgi:Tfp pilus assembly protein PilX